jgi:hypothetical protein
MELDIEGISSRTSIMEKAISSGLMIVLMLVTLFGESCMGPGNTATPMDGSMLESSCVTNARDAVFSPGKAAGGTTVNGPTVSETDTAWKLRKTVKL